MPTVPQRTPERAPFESVYRLEFQAVWNWFRRLGVPRQQRVDLVQETFEIALRRYDRFESDRPARPWLYGIAFRVLVAQRRKLYATVVFVDEVLDTLSSDTDLEHQLFLRQAREWVWQALQTLSLEQRAVFVMSELDGLRMPEIAEVLELPLNTAYSRLRLARQAVSSWLAKHLPQGERP